MPKSYSADLRERVIQAVEMGASRHEAADRFEVSGFTWSGAEKISRKAEWPDWNPPEQMIERQPYLPRER